MGSIAWRVLVVDDHATDRLKMSMAVKNLGHNVEAAKDGQEAMEKLQNTNFDLVLLDLWMPVMDGYDLLAAKRADPRLRDIPVIVVSSRDDTESVRKAIELGAREHLPKPFDLTLLQERVRTCLENTWR
jgi:sigma-B regulation protein RsbU (phosphoserine phosphatase)